MPLFPQKLWNVTLAERIDVQANPAIVEALSQAEARLSGRGRVNVRMSGTEPKLRVMVEADDESLMLETGQQLVDVVMAEVSA